MVQAAWEPLGQGWLQLGELGLAFVLSSLIGLERELRKKFAGLRTHTLVGLGAALFMCCRPRLCCMRRSCGPNGAPWPRPRRLHSSTYEVDAALVGSRVELIFDPFDLSELWVRYQGREMGTAISHRIGRHVHPAANPRPAPTPCRSPGSTTSVWSATDTPPR